MLCREWKIMSVGRLEDLVQDPTKSAYTCKQKIDGAFVVNAFVSLESKDVERRRVAPEVVDVFKLYGLGCIHECWHSVLKEPGWQPCFLA
jgi:hypothetical protein